MALTDLQKVIKGNPSTIFNQSHTYQVRRYVTFLSVRSVILHFFNKKIYSVIAYAVQQFSKAVTIAQLVI